MNNIVRCKICNKDVDIEHYHTISITYSAISKYKTNRNAQFFHRECFIDTAGEEFLPPFPRHRRK